MTKQELERSQQLQNTLVDLGFTVAESKQLRKISHILQNWFEMECGNDVGVILRDEESGEPFLINTKGHKLPINDRENIAKKSLSKIISARNTRAALNAPAYSQLAAYIQTDPRGAALYILRPGDVPDGKKAECHYSNGICVY